MVRKRRRAAARPVDASGQSNFPFLSLVFVEGVRLHTVSPNLRVSSRGVASVKQRVVYLAVGGRIAGRAPFNLVADGPRWPRARACPLRIMGTLPKLTRSAPRWSARFVFIAQTYRDSRISSKRLDTFIWDVN